MKKTLSMMLLSVCAGIAFSTMTFAADATTTPAMPAAKPAVETTMTTPAADATAFTPAQVTQLHTIIHDYLVANPQVLVEASQALQAQQEKQMQTAAMGAIAQNKAALFNDASSPMIGNKEAPVTLVEFFDYQCGHCREMAPQIEKLVKEDTNLRVVFKELPIFGGMSKLAAEMALAAFKQSPEKYYAFHNALYSANGPLTRESIMDFAKKAGLNAAELEKESKSQAIQDQLKANFELAQSLKIMGTPTFVIGNKAETKFAFIPGSTSLSDLQAQIKSVQ